MGRKNRKGGEWRKEEGEEMGITVGVNGKGVLALTAGIFCNFDLAGLQ